MSKIILFDEKSKCSACSACYNICPLNAIDMKPNEFGFMYPIINHNLCIKCGKCNSVCDWKRKSIDDDIPSHIETYAASRKDDYKILDSSSGGVFAVIAEEVLKRDGIVYGCSLEYEKEKLVPKHISINNINNLTKLLGSKYVQSDLGSTFKEILVNLKKGKFVLFTGVPCQVGGLKNYLGKEYKNLLTIDLICHGVPNAEFFQRYIRFLENKKKKKICNFKFRTKEENWGLNAKIVFDSYSDKNDEELLHSNKSSYYSMFLNSEIYRDSCYHCIYANSNRVSDITLGDYWGISEEHSEFLKSCGGNLDEKKGVSLILLNTNKGQDLFNSCKERLYFYKSKLDKAKKHNAQLNAPSKQGAHRIKILELYKNNEYREIDNYYKRILFYQKWKRRFMNFFRG